MGTSWARIRSITRATRAVVAFCANRTLVGRLFAALMTDRARLAVRNTSRIEVIVKCARWTCDHASVVGTVSSLRTWHKLKVGSAWLTVVARRALGASISLTHTAFFGAKVTHRALGLHTLDAVGATRTQIAVRWNVTHFWAKESIRARRASSLTPLTVSGLEAHSDVVICVVDAPPWRHRRTVLRPRD